MTYIQLIVRPSWDPPKTYVDLTSPGVVVLDITVVPDVYGPSWWPDRSGPGAARWFPEHCPGLGAWRSCRASRIPQTDVRKCVIHGGLTCSPNVCGGPDETLTAMSVVPVDGMTEFQVDMESLRWDCKREFGSGRPGDCPHCDLYVNISLSRHIMTFHLALAKMMKMTGDCDDPNPCDEMYGSPHKDLFVSLTVILLSLRVFLHLVSYLLE